MAFLPDREVPSFTDTAVEAYLKSQPDLSLAERGLGNTKSMVKKERPLEQQISSSQEPVLGLSVVTFR